MFTLLTLSFPSPPQSSNILLNVVVDAEFQLAVESLSKVVMGVDSKGTAYTLEPEGRFSTTTVPVILKRVRERMHVHTCCLAKSKASSVS